MIDQTECSFLHEASPVEAIISRFRHQHVQWQVINMSEIRDDIKTLMYHATQTLCNLMVNLLSLLHETFSYIDGYLEKISTSFLL